MPRVKPPRKELMPIPSSCLYDRGFYEVYADNVLMSQHRTKRDAQKEASRLRKPRPRRIQITISYKSVCTWGGEICKYWKRCYDEKGTIFTQPWGKKKVMLLEMKREPLSPKPRNDRGLDEFK